jgi:hypothetical protein
VRASDGAAPTLSAYELLGAGVGTGAPQRAQPVGPGGEPRHPAPVRPDRLPDRVPPGLDTVPGAFGRDRAPLHPPARATRPGHPTSFQAARLAAVLAVVVTLVPLSLFAVHLAARAGLPPPTAGSQGRAAGSVGRPAAPQSPAATPGRHPGRRASSTSRAGRRRQLDLGRRERAGVAGPAVVGAVVTGPRRPESCAVPPAADTGRTCGRHRSTSPRRVGPAAVG